ncbi:MAG: hypothetical protein COT91_00040 [Candidatus Doudnabacteria bacterium CG10_big_fil_rev_8_21_14_0_10_41_10]|uniref:RecF/RecN/SMC N-terminal domain-containing protein n=1 Tax=Candidatus Doudnabacteria bacterium CG10_big_fil_rev_8_21_14_0_10_41_10 TaxID=1974551 RepID=A0A2H0VF59_9BACT|nr:MAG: hypothetical protein COT91_00040 [Candidatus Doudnabacteria bacterium CG10_big_fil_rev_8_21_14_0_10_41_10]
MHCYFAKSFFRPRRISLGLRLLTLTFDFFTVYLKKLEIQGFKSFAKKTTLLFDKGIISVVGPNGSGKSNLSDSIRWVMGEQSMKAVRSKKGEDVIFAGSDKKGKQGMAEVSITFDNNDRKIPLDFSEVVITRRIFRNGESEYLINKRPVRLMDIVEILAKSGYGGYSYHIISQGTIDQLILAGPTAIKTLIEEASGVKPYYMKKERSVRKLDRSQQNLIQVASLVSEIEPRLRSLRRQTKRMEQRDEIAKDLYDSQMRFFSSRFHKYKNELSEFDGKTGYFDKEIKTLLEEIEALTKVLQEKEKSAEKNGKDYQVLQEDLRRMEKEKNKMQEDLAIVRGQLKVGAPGASADLQSLNNRKLEIRAKMKELEGRVDTFIDQIRLNEKNLSDHIKIFERTGSELEKVKGMLGNKKPENLSEIKTEIEKVYSRYQSLLYQINNLHSEEDFDSLQKEALSLELFLVNLKDKLTKLSFGNEENTAPVQSQLNDLFSQRDEVQKQLSKIEVEVSTAKAQKEFYDQELEDLKTELSRVELNILDIKGVSSGNPMEELVKKEEKLSNDLQKFLNEIFKFDIELKRFLENEMALKKELLEKERELRLKQDNLGKTKDQRGLVLIEKARVDANMETLVLEIEKNLGQGATTKIQTIEDQNIEEGLEQKIYKLRVQLESIGSVDDLTMQEFRETEQRYNYLTSQSADLEKAIKDLKEVVAELEAIIKKQFQNGFEKINSEFSEYFRVLFSGGRANMTLIKEKKAIKPQDENGNGNGNGAENGEEELDEDLPTKEMLTGIDIRVTPPGKKLASISALSGGERALTAIALLMAILSSFPSPFLVLDEVDAALDEANSIRLGKILARLAHQTQFITITHNRETMRQSKALYGVTMGDDGISKVLSIKLEKAVEIAE